MEHQTTGRVSQLEKEVHSFREEMHSQSRSIGELAAIQAMQGQRLDKIGDGVEKLIDHKSNSNPFTLPIVLTLMGAVFLGYQGITTYLALQMDPLVDRVSGVEVHLQDIEDFRAETHYEVARANAVRERLDHLDGFIHGMQEDISELKVKAATSQTSTRAVGDYVREHVNLTHGDKQ